MNPGRLTLLPAIDIRRGRLVRLREGRPDEEFSYAPSPLAWAEELVDEGAAMLHLIDLGAAFGEPPSTETLRQVIGAAAVPVQVGGGIRTLERVRELLDLGAGRLLVSTRALEDPGFLAEAVAVGGPERIVVALDFKEGKLRVRGWLESLDADLAALGASFRALGLGRLLVTAVARDGTLSGPDVGLWRAAGDRTGMRVIGAGGVSSLDDLRTIRGEDFPALEAVVIGRALVERRFRYAEAVAALRGDE